MNDAATVFVGVTRQENAEAWRPSLNPEDRESNPAPSERSRYFCGLGLLHFLLRRHAETSAARSRIGVTSKGKPFLRNSTWKFSVAHCDPWTVVGISRIALGIDAERCDRKVDWSCIIGEQFPEEVGNRIVAEPAENQRIAFLREWTRIEAHAKFTGEGLILPISKSYLSNPHSPFRTSELIGSIVMERPAERIQLNLISGWVSG